MRSSVEGGALQGPRISPDKVMAVRCQLRRFTLEHESGLRQIESKILLLCDEFLYMHD